MQNLIKEKRLEKGLEINYMADHLALSTRQYRRIENAELLTYNLKTLDRLSKMLNIPVLDLFHYLIGAEC